MLLLFLKKIELQRLMLNNQQPLNKQPLNNQQSLNNNHQNAKMISHKNSWTERLYGGNDKHTMKENSMIFAIKNDFVDDFCNLFIFFEYNVEAVLCTRKICSEKTIIIKKIEIISYVTMYNASNILKYLLNNSFVGSNSTNFVINAAKYYSLECLEIIFGEYELGKEGIYNMLKTVIHAKKLSFYEKKHIIEIIISESYNINYLNTNCENIVCLAMNNKQYELAAFLIEKCGCLLLHGSSHLRTMKNDIEGFDEKGLKKPKDTNDKLLELYSKIKLYKDELYLQKSVIKLMMLGHNYDENSDIYKYKLPRDVMRCVLKIYYEDRIEKIYRMKELC